MPRIYATANEWNAFVKAGKVTSMKDQAAKLLQSIEVWELELSMAYKVAKSMTKYMNSKGEVKPLEYWIKRGKSHGIASDMSRLLKLKQARISKGYL